MRTKEDELSAGEDEQSRTGGLKRCIYKFFYWLILYNSIPFAVYCALEFYEAVQIFLIAVKFNPDPNEFFGSWRANLDYLSVFLLHVNSPE